jgi:hypothetical protein
MFHPSLKHFANNGGGIANRFTAQKHVFHRRFNPVFDAALNPDSGAGVVITVA